jgi:DNA-directed RNA polymerase subunit RPC12/RpoP
MMYRCDNCEDLFDDDYEPMETHPFGDVLLTRADDMVCPSCYDELMADMLEALEEDHGL